MKAKSKTSKGNIIVECKKSQKRLNQSKNIKSVSKKTQQQARKSLQSTLRLLQHRLNIKKQQPVQKTLLGLSQSIYNIIQTNIPQRPKMSLVATQDSSQQSSTITALTNKDRQRSYSSHSSTIMDYFKQKFDNNSIIDEKAVEKKLRALQALKKSQQFVTKYNSQYNISISSIPQIGCDIGGKKVVISKIKNRVQ